MWELVVMYALCCRMGIGRLAALTPRSEDGMIVDASTTLPAACFETADGSNAMPPTGVTLA